MDEALDFSCFSFDDPALTELGSSEELQDDAQNEILMGYPLYVTLLKNFKTMMKVVNEKTKLIKKIKSSRQSALKELEETKSKLQIALSDVDRMSDNLKFQIDEFSEERIRLQDAMTATESHSEQLKSLIEMNQIKFDFCPSPRPKPKPPKATKKTPEISEVTSSSISCQTYAQSIETVTRMVQTDPYPELEPCLKCQRTLLDFEDKQKEIDYEPLQHLESPVSLDFDPSDREQHCRELESEFLHSAEEALVNLEENRGLDSYNSHMEMSDLGLEEVERGSERFASDRCPEIVEDRSNQETSKRRESLFHDLLDDSAEEVEEVPELMSVEQDLEESPSAVSTCVRTPPIFKSNVSLTEIGTSDSLPVEPDEGLPILCEGLADQVALEPVATKILEDNQPKSTEEVILTDKIEAEPAVSSKLSSPEVLDEIDLDQQIKSVTPISPLNLLTEEISEVVQPICTTDHNVVEKIRAESKIALSEELFGDLDEQIETVMPISPLRPVSEEISEVVQPNVTLELTLAEESQPEPALTTQMATKEKSAEVLVETMENTSPISLPEPVVLEKSPNLIPFGKSSVEPVIVVTEKSNNVNLVAIIEANLEERIPTILLPLADKSEITQTSWPKKIQKSNPVEKIVALPSPSEPVLLVESVFTFPIPPVKAPEKLQVEEPAASREVVEPKKRSRKRASDEELFRVLEEMTRLPSLITPFPPDVRQFKKRIRRLSAEPPAIRLDEEKSTKSVKKAELKMTGKSQEPVQEIGDVQNTQGGILKLVKETVDQEMKDSSPEPVDKTMEQDVEENVPEPVQEFSEVEMISLFDDQLLAIIENPLSPLKTQSDEEDENFEKSAPMETLDASVPVEKTVAGRIQRPSAYEVAQFRQKLAPGSYITANKIFKQHLTCLTVMDEHFCKEMLDEVLHQLESLPLGIAVEVLARAFLLPVAKVKPTTPLNDSKPIPMTSTEQRAVFVIKKLEERCPRWRDLSTAVTKEAIKLMLTSRRVPYFFFSSVVFKPFSRLITTLSMLAKDSSLLKSFLQLCTMYLPLDAPAIGETIVGAWPTVLRLDSDADVALIQRLWHSEDQGAAKPLRQLLDSIFGKQLHQKMLTSYNNVLGRAEGGVC